MARHQNGNGNGKLPHVDLGADPEYAAASAKLEELQAGRRTAAADLQEAVAERASARPGRLIEVQVEALLQGRQADAPVDASWLSKRINDLEQRVRAYDEAIERQKTTVNSALGAASRRICERLASEHGKRGARVYLAAQELSEAVEDEQAFRAHLEAHGVRTSTLSAAPLRYRALSARQGTPAHRWLNEMAEAFPEVAK